MLLMVLFRMGFETAFAKLMRVLGPVIAALSLHPCCCSSVFGPWHRSNSASKAEHVPRHRSTLPHARGIRTFRPKPPDQSGRQITDMRNTALCGTRRPRAAGERRGVTRGATITKTPAPHNGRCFTSAQRGSQLSAQWLAPQMTAACNPTPSTRAAIGCAHGVALRLALERQSKGRSLA